MCMCVHLYVGGCVYIFVRVCTCVWMCICACVMQRGTLTSSVSTLMSQFSSLPRQRTITEQRCRTNEDSGRDSDGPLTRLQSKLTFCIAPREN